MARIPTPSEVDLSKYDVIIIGSGPAGCSLADRLSARLRSCLIIETGIEVYDEHIQSAYTSMQTQGHFGDQHWARHWIRAFGGTSAVWGGWCAPLDEEDFETWPIQLSDLRPYYDDAARLLELDPVINAYNTPYRPGFRFKPFRRVYGAMRFGQQYRRFLTATENVDVLLGTSLTRIHPNSARDTIKAISLCQQNQAELRLQLRPHQHLVLAAGAMGNAQLMLRPVEGGGIGIGNETDQVGRFLMEHPHYFDAAALVGRKSLTPPKPPENFGEYVANLIQDRALYSESGKVSAAIELVERAPNPSDRVERYLNDRYRGDFVTYSLNLRTEMRALPENRVTLAQGRDPSGLPLLKTMCMTGSESVEPLFKLLEALGQTVLERDEGRVFIHNDVLAGTPEGGGHTMGTTAMGDDPKTSVVDADCRVHNYANLYVSGGSVFTTGGSANPTLTIIALAIRLADHLAGET